MILMLLFSLNISVKTVMVNSLGLRMLVRVMTLTVKVRALVLTSLTISPLALVTVVWQQVTGVEQLTVCIHVLRFDNSNSGPNLPVNFDVDSTGPVDYFELLFESQLYDHIAAETNKYAKLRQEEKGVDPRRTPTRAVDIKAFICIGITLKRGVIYFCHEAKPRGRNISTRVFV